MLLLVTMTTRSMRVALKFWNRGMRNANITTEYLSPLRMCKLHLSSSICQQFSFYWWRGNGQRKRLFQPARFSFFFILARHCTGRTARFYETCLISLSTSVFGRNCIWYLIHNLWQALYKRLCSFRSVGRNDGYGPASGLMPHLIECERYCLAKLQSSVLKWHTKHFLEYGMKIMNDTAHFSWHFFFFLHAHWDLAQGNHNRVYKSLSNFFDPSHTISASDRQLKKNSDPV